MISKKTKKKIWYISKDYFLPDFLLLAVLKIETIARPWYARILEYLLLLLAFFLNKAFKQPIKNYTVGKSQLGIARILNFYGALFYPHIKFLPTISFKQFIIIYKTVFSTRQYIILADFLSKIYYRAKNIYPETNENACINIIRYTGEQYNGRFSYGLHLLDTLNKFEAL